MKAYFSKYANYFIILGGILLIMYFNGYVPLKFKNSPELFRWLFPSIFLLVGVFSKFIDKEALENNTDNNNSNNSNNYHSNYTNYNYSNNDITLPDELFKHQENKSINNTLNNDVKNEFSNPKEWLEANPGKSLNDYYKWRNS